MEQLVARWAHNPKVVSSSLAPATLKRRIKKLVLLFSFFNSEYLPNLTYLVKMNYFVYVLYSEKFDKIYIGMTSNLEQRVFSHNHLPKGWTKNFRPWMLVYSEELPSKRAALIREKELKSHKGRDFIRSLI